MTQFASTDAMPVYPLSAQPGATALLDVMAEAVAFYPALTIQFDTTIDGGLAEVDHETGRITISPAASRAEKRCALLACLLHLVQGRTDDEGADNRAVQEQVARLLVPRAALPANLDSADPEAVARDLGVDLRTAHAGIALARTASVTGVAA